MTGLLPLYTKQHRQARVHATLKPSSLSHGRPSIQNLPVILIPAPRDQETKRSKSSITPHSLRRRVKPNGFAAWGEKKNSLPMRKRMATLKHSNASTVKTGDFFPPAHLACICMSVCTYLWREGMAKIIRD
jgi:hypothetical protein